METGLARHVGECAIAVVAVENVLTEVGDKQIFVPVVVVITHREPTPIPLARGPPASSRP